MQEYLKHKQENFPESSGRKGKKRQWQDKSQDSVISEKELRALVESAMKAKESKERKRAGRDAEVRQQSDDLYSIMIAGVDKVRMTRSSSNLQAPQGFSVNALLERYQEKRRKNLSITITAIRSIGFENDPSVRGDLS